MKIEEKRLKLISRISNVENEDALNEIERILNLTEKREFNFEAEWEKGLSPNEFLEEMKKRISAWPWKR
jgi:hypothetical protein